jgi:signal transduction histidine kinase
VVLDNPSEKDPVMRDLSEITVTALKDLELARQELQENDLHMKEMNKLANERVDEMSRVNQQLQTKISFVENIATGIREKNDKLESDIKIVKNEKNRYLQLNDKLKTDLGKVIRKEKELSVKQIFLERKIETQTDDLKRTEKISIIGQFTARLSHDMRNPLSKLKMSHEILCNNPNLNVLEKIKHQQRIDVSISTLVRIIEDVLEFVRISDLHMNDILLDDVISSSIEGLNAPSSVIIERIGESIHVLCDSKKLEAVLINILTNAVDAIEKNGTIRIKTVSTSKNVVIQFVDSGVGVPPGDESKIFDPMFTTKSYGSGLGLTISKMIIEQHGGKLEYRSNPSTFSIFLPKT